MAKKLRKEKSSAEPSEIEIPDVASQPDVNLEDFLILMYGVEGVGKSTFASKLDNTLFITTEPGLKFLKTRKVVCGNWLVFQQIIRKLEEGTDARCIVVDTVDNLSKFCLNYVCEVNNFKHPSDAEWGKGWEAFYDEWHHWIMRLCNLDKGIMFIGHSTEKEVTFRNMKIDKTMPAIPKTTYKLLVAICDFVMYAGFKRIRDEETNAWVEHRTLYTQPSMEIAAKDRSGVLPAEMPLDCEQFKDYLADGKEEDRNRKEVSAKSKKKSRKKLNR